MIFRVAPLLLALLASPATAQTMQGRVLDADSGAPISGAIVKAIGTGGETVTGTLTNDLGNFTLFPPAGIPVGSVAIERIGYSTHVVEASTFGAAPVVLRVDFSPVELSGIVVTAESLCGARFRDNGGVQAIWDEARKSLEVTTLTQANRVLRYELESFERDLRPSDYAVLRGTASRRVIDSSNPYRSISVEQMTERGWVDGTATTGMDLWAPDASVLMTEEFAGQHCFSGEVAPEAVSLHFTPNEERRSLPELEGTLVLDPETAELRELQFRYVRVPGLQGGGAHAGGDIEFFTAPNGLIVVREWAIRSPALTVVRTGVGSLATERVRVDRVHEQGGRVLAIHTADATVELSTGPLDLGSPDRSVAAGQAASTRALTSGRGAELLLQNNDPQPFRVTRVRLRDCVNTALPCGDYPVDVVVEPGVTETLFRVTKRRMLRGFSFDWDYVGGTVEAFEPEPR